MIQVAVYFLAFVGLARVARMALALTRKTLARAGRALASLEDASAGDAIAAVAASNRKRAPIALVKP